MGFPEVDYLCYSGGMTQDESTTPATPVRKFMLTYQAKTRTVMFEGRTFATTTLGLTEESILSWEDAIARANGWPSALVLGVVELEG